MACVNISGRLYQRDSVSAWINSTTIGGGTGELDDSTFELLWLDFSAVNSTIGSTAASLPAGGLVSSGSGIGSSGIVCMSNPEQMLEPWEINKNLAMLISYSVIFVIGVLGNITAMLGMIGDRKSRNATTLFLVSLSAADLLLLLVCAPLEALQYFVIQWDEDGTICKTAKYAEVLSAVASVLNLTAVSLERFIVIVFPIRSRSVCTMSNCRRAVLVVWVVSLLLTAPVFFTKGTNPWTFTDGQSSIQIFYCEDKGDGRIFAIYQAIILLLAPGLVMIICYTYVIRELWISTRNMRVLTNTNSSSEHATCHSTGHRQEERKWRVGGPPQWMVNHHAVPALNTQNPAASMMRATMTASSTEGGSSVAADETTTSSVMVKSHDGDEDYLCERNRRLSTPPISSSLLTCQSCGSMSPPPLIMTAATMSPPTARDAVLPRSIPLRESPVVLTRNGRSTLKQQHQRGHQARAEEARNARKQVIKMLILVIVLFLICWGSRLSMEMAIKFGLDNFSPEIYFLRIAINLLPYVHSCLNPFIYSLMSKNFRRSMIRRLHSCFRSCRSCCCRRRHHPSGGDYSPSQHTHALSSNFNANDDLPSQVQMSRVRSIATRLTHHHQRPVRMRNTTPLLLRRNNKRPSLCTSTTVVVPEITNNGEMDSTMV